MQLSSSFIDDLSPQEKRYDLEIDPNLFISVLPNGAKTWVLCDMVLGKPRRKTLGVYPEMSLSDARDTVEQIANVGRHPEPLAVPDKPAAVKSPTASPSLTIRDGRIVPAAPSRWPLIAAAAAGLTVVVVAALFWMRSGGEPVVPADAGQSPLASGTPLPADTTGVDRTADERPAQIADHAGGSASDQEAAEDSPSGQLATAAGDLAEPDEQLAQTAPVEPSAASTPDSTNNSAGATPAPIAPAPEATGAGNAVTLALATNDDAMATTEQLPAPEPEKSADAAAEPTQAQGPASVEPQPVENAAPASVQEAAAIDRPAAIMDDEVDDGTPAEADSATSMTAGAVSDIPQTPAPARGVARYQLTSEIRAREPTDDLRQTVDGGGADISRVYFFTDLRGLAGETVTHRWLYNGEISASVNFNVDGWRWRVYSSKDLLLGQGGEWIIEVVDEAGALLASHSFSYFP